jgi:D-sedoheptulose 7-phosphate isomerase
MSDSALDFTATLREYIAGLKAVLDALPGEQLREAAELIQRAYEEGRQVFVAGNGGSASTASHMACDLSKTVLGTPPRPNVRRFKIIALNDNVPLLTAWGNDASYDTVFAEQLRNLANPGDLLVVITASGSSPNIVEAVKAASDLGLHTIGLLGFDGGRVLPLLDQAIVIGSSHYGYIEDAHLMVNHFITDHFQRLVSRQREAARVAAR